MSNTQFTKSTEGELSPMHTGNEAFVSPNDRTVPPCDTVQPLAANGSAAAPHAVSARAPQGAGETSTPSVTGVVEAASQGATPASPLYSTFVPSQNFGWHDDGVDIYFYTKWYQHDVLFEVGYKKAPDGTYTFSERRVTGERGSAKYSHDMRGVQRVLYGLFAISRADYILFAENEFGVMALNRRLRELEKEMVATTTSGGIGQSRKTGFGTAIEGKQVVVFVSSHSHGGRHADDICRAALPYATSVKRIELPNLAPTQTHEDYFEALDHITDLYDVIAAAPLWVDTTSNTTAPQ